MEDQIVAIVKQCSGMRFTPRNRTTFRKNYDLIYSAITGSGIEPTCAHIWTLVMLSRMHRVDVGLLKGIL